MKKFLSLILVFFCVKVYSQSQAICAGSSGTINAPVSSTLITPSSTFNNTQPNFIVSPTVTTNYTLLTPPSGASVVITVTVNPMPVVSPSYTQPTCSSTLCGFNFNLTFNPTSPPPTYTVTWAPPPPPLTTTIPVVPDCVTAPTDYSCIGAISPGSYQASVTAAGGCKVVVSFTINPAPAPALYTLQPAASVVSITCAQPNPTIFANNPGLTYTWTSPSFLPVYDTSVSLTSSNTPSFTVVGTNTNSGCTLTKTVSVVVYTTIPIGTLSPSNISISCTNPAIPDITLTCSNPTVNFTHHIIPPSLSPWTSNLTTAFYQVGGPGTYSYSLVNDANGCIINKTFTVTSLNTYPTYTLSSPQSFTLGCSTKSAATVVFANPQGGTPGASLSYTFIPPGGNPNIVGPYSGIPSTVVTTAGQWTVICFETGSNCQTKATMSIIQNTVAPALDTVTIDRGRILDVAGKPCGVLTCDSTTVLLHAFSETPNISYLWSYGSNPVQNLTSPTVAVTASIALTSLTVANVGYSLTLRDNGNFCTSSSTYTVYHNVAAPTTSFAPQNNGTNFLNCLKPEIALTNQSSTKIPPFFNPTNRVIGFLWKGPSPSIDLSLSSSYTAGVVGVYTMTGKDLDNGCTSTFTLEIFGDFIPPTYSVEPQDFKLDCGAMETLTASIATKIFTTGNANPDRSSYTYTWTAPEILPGSINTGTAFVPKSVGNYTVLVTNTKNGCATKTVVAVGPAKLNGVVDASTNFGYAPLEVNFFNNSYSGVNVTGGIVSFWNFGNGSASITASSGTATPNVVISNSASIKYNLPGVYSTKVLITKGQCRDSVTKVVTVDIPSSLTVPNIFTPNGDGINDLYFLKTNSVSKISMSIFDRWGRLIFEIKESTTGNIVWDGKNPDGKDAPDGTYFYFLNATGKDGKEFSSKGNITLAR